MRFADLVRDGDDGFPHEVNRGDMVKIVQCHTLQREHLKGHHWSCDDEVFADGHPDGDPRSEDDTSGRSCGDRCMARNGTALWRLQSKFASAV